MIMMNVSLIAVGKLKESYWRDACAEYEKRLSAFCRFRIVELPETRLPERPSQAQIDAAVADAQKNMPGAVTESDEYKAVAAERDMLRALGGSEFASVKPKFREAVYKMLDHAPEAESVENQLKTIAENYEEYFTPTQPAEPAKSPQFGAGVEGSMPTGKQERSFGAYWSFGRPKGEK